MTLEGALGLRNIVAGVALAMGLAAAHAGPKPEVKYALVVGNSAYEADFMKLKTPARDAADMAVTLKTLGFEVDLKIDATEQQFRDAVDNLERRALEADFVLVYYAGRGLQFRRKNFLLPVDNIPRDIVDVKRHAITVDWLVEAIAAARKAKIVILDASRDGAAARKKPVAQSLGGDGEGLAPVGGAEGLYVFYSTQSGKVAYEGDKGEHSPFAASLMRHIAEPGRRLVDVLDDVSQDVSRATQGVQQPELMTSPLAAKSEIVLNPRESSAAAWLRVKVAKDPRALKQFVADYPDSPEAETAQAVLDRIAVEARERAEEKAKR